MPQTKASALNSPGEQLLRHGRAVALAELGAHRLGRGQAARVVGGDEAFVALEEVGSGVGVADEAQVCAAVLPEQVLGQPPRSLVVLGRDRLDAVPGVAGDDDDRLAGAADVGCLRAENRDAVDPGRQGAHRTVAVVLGSGEHQHDALLELGGAGLEADQQLGVVGAGQLGQDQTVGVVVPNGQAASGARGKVVELVNRGEHLAAGSLAHHRGPLEHPRHRRDGDAGLGGDGVDRRPSPGLALRACHGCSRP